MNHKIKAESNVSSHSQKNHPPHHDAKDYTGRQKQFEDMHHYVNELVRRFVDSLDYNLWDNLQQFASVCKHAFLLSNFLQLMQAYLEQLNQMFIRTTQSAKVCTKQ